MEQAKKIEIIANSLELDKVLASLEQAGIPGYTVIRNVIGRSAKVKASDDLARTVLSNVYVVALCPEAQVNKVADILKPTLEQFGGVCFVTDAQWLIH